MSTLRAAPIIHTRTLNCDFNPGFLVRPTTFSQDDVNWVRSKILSATSEIDGLQGVRWIVLDNQKYRVAGVVGFLKNICSRCHLSEDDLEKSREMFCDNKERMVYAFIGIVVDKSCEFEYGKLSEDDLWSLYLKEVYPVWKRTYQQIIFRPFSDVTLKPISTQKRPSGIFIAEKQLWESNPESDYESFLYFFCNQDCNFSFCSNLNDFLTVQKSDFTLISTSGNIISRMKKKYATDESFHQGEKSLGVCETQSSESTKDCQKKNSLQWTIGFLILIIFILIFILLILVK